MADDLENALSVDLARQINEMLTGRSAEITADALAISVATLISAYQRPEHANLLREFTLTVARYIPPLVLQRQREKLKPSKKVN